MRGLALRVMGVTGAVALGVLCTAAAFDRANFIGAAVRIPYGFDLGVGSTERNAVMLLATGANKEAIATARQLVARDPLGQHSLSLLGTAQLMNGDADGAHAAYVAAGKMGWRDPATQIYLLDTAIGLEDASLAAQRLDALRRMWANSGEITERAIAFLESSEEGRQALAERLALNPKWKTDYLASIDGAPAGDLEHRLDVLAAARKAGMTVSDEQLSKLLHSLIRSGEISLAARMTQRFGASDFTATVRNSGFEAPINETAPNPFEWLLRSNANASVRIDEAPAPLEGKALRIDSSGTVRSTVAEQYLVLPPGIYEVRWRSVGGGGGKAEPIFLSIACQPSNAPLRADATVPHGNHVSTASFSVPAADCGAQTLKLVVLPQDATERKPLWIDDMTIRKL